MNTAITGDEPSMPGMANLSEEGELLNTYKTGCVSGFNYGLSIRQYFAARAMSTMAGAWLSDNVVGWDENDISEQAVKFADALISELNKKK